jgi:hypothetical protein
MYKKDCSVESIRKIDDLEASVTYKFISQKKSNSTHQVIFKSANDNFVVIKA